MKLMQKDYPMLAIVEVELTQEKEMDELPNRPSKFDRIFFVSPLPHITNVHCKFSRSWGVALLSRQTYCWPGGGVD